MATNYQRGAARERQLVHHLRSLGWVAYRTPASKGACDVIALRHGEIQLLQVKAGKTAFGDFGPAHRERLSLEAAQAGGAGLLAWYSPDRSGLRLIPESEWPT